MKECYTIASVAYLMPECSHEMWYLYMWVNIVEELCVRVTSHFLIHL